VWSGGSQKPLRRISDEITLARIDDRLIHGQVTTVWSKVANAQRIIICNDDVFNDEVRRTLFARPRRRA
jgi:mannose/fructose/N-acetylgalactosamine-specific phosphotransferase system component IIB